MLNVIWDILAYPASSGLLGALAGAYVGYRGTINAMKEQLKVLEKTEIQRREFEKERQGRTMVDSISIELEENLLLLNSNYVENARIPLQLESWNLVKQNVDYLSDELRKEVLYVYGKISLYNVLVGYFMNHLINRGSTEWLDKPLRECVNDLKVKIPDILLGLEASYRAKDSDRLSGLVFEKSEKDMN